MCVLKIDEKQITRMRRKIVFYFRNVINTENEKNVTRLLEHIINALEDLYRMKDITPLYRQIIRRVIKEHFVTNKKRVKKRKRRAIIELCTRVFAYLLYSYFIVELPSENKSQIRTTYKIGPGFMPLMTDEQLFKELVSDKFYHFMVSQGVSSYENFILGIIPLVFLPMEELEKRREQSVEHKIFFDIEIQRAERYLKCPNISDEMKDKIKDKLSWAVRYRDVFEKNEGIYNVAIRIKEKPHLVKELQSAKALKSSI